MEAIVTGFSNVISVVSYEIASDNAHHDRFALDHKTSFIIIWDQKCEVRVMIDEISKKLKIP